MNNPTPEFNRRPSRPWIVGAMLILIGVLLLAAQFLEFNGLVRLQWIQKSDKRMSVEEGAVRCKTKPSI